MLDVVGADGLVVIANTGDDIEIYRAYVSPDTDLITFWLADLIDERGWGLAGDTFKTMDGLRELGVQVWFNLGDKDLAIGLERARALAAGARLSEAQAAVARAVGVGAAVLPMSDEPVRTRVRTKGTWWPIQEFLIKGRGEGPVEDVEFGGVHDARPTAEVLDVIQQARAIVIGPSNPVISIGPILAVPGVREALIEADAAVVAVSPLVRGAVVKGPTEPFMEWTGQPLTTTGIARLYDGLLDGLVADERTELVPVLETDVMMDSAAARSRVAEETLRFALALGGSA
jgi:LPPG:FO 2-phospho-L-lactate transferase